MKYGKGNLLIYCMKSLSLKGNVMRKGCFFLVLITLFFSVSCEPLPCLDTRIPSLGIEFEQDSAGNTFSRSISNDSLFQVFSSKTISFHKSRTSYSKWQLSLVSEESSFWIVAFDSLRKDSIRFTYQTQPFFVSESCGYRAIYSNLSVDKVGGDRFKDVKIVKLIVDTTKAVHAKIILK